MAKVGNFGKLITFEVKRKKVLTFSGLTQNVSGRWAIHERFGKRPKSEFQGAGLRTASLEIMLSVALEIKPRKVMEKIEKAIESGRVEKLVIGGKKVGKNKWKIISMSETWDTILKKGELAQATLSLELEEYV